MLSLGEVLADDFLRLADGFHTLGLMRGNRESGGENLAGLQLGRQGDSKLGHAHPLRERHGLILAESASGLGGDAGEGVEVLDLVAPVGECGDALLFGESLASDEESVEGEGELLCFHGVVLFWVGCPELDMISITYPRLEIGRTTLFYGVARLAMRSCVCETSLTQGFGIISYANHGLVR